jgi:hypothetical protein
MGNGFLERYQARPACAKRHYICPLDNINLSRVRRLSVPLPIA